LSFEIRGRKVEEEESKEDQNLNLR